METYSIHEAKARFSEIIRQVREGKTVAVSYRGKPVAEIRPIEEASRINRNVRISGWEELVRQGDNSTLKLYLGSRYGAQGGIFPARWNGSSLTVDDSYPASVYRTQSCLRGHFRSAWLLNSRSVVGEVSRTSALNSFHELLVSSNLLEAEVSRAAFLRERRDLFIRHTGLILTGCFPPARCLPEIAMAQSSGYLRGADLWHVANALYVAHTHDGVVFITTDQRQYEVASALDFETYRPCQNRPVPLTEAMDSRLRGNDGKDTGMTGLVLWQVLRLFHSGWARLVRDDDAPRL